MTHPVCVHVFLCFYSISSLLLFIQKRTTLQSTLRAKADDILNTWETIRQDLLNKIGLFVMRAKESRAELAVELWNASEDYRRSDLKRISTLRDSLRGEMRENMGQHLIEFDSQELDLFRFHNDLVDNILTTTNKEINEVEYMPGPLRAFMREINNRPIHLHDNMRSLAFDFYRTHPFDDDTVYELLHTAEQLYLCLDSIKSICEVIMEEYTRDKRTTFRRLCQGSSCENMDSRPQVASILEMIVSTVEAEDELGRDLSRQEGRTFSRNQGIDSSITSFLAANSLPGAILPPPSPLNKIS